MKSHHTRYLPHLYTTGRPLFITWRLHGSLPERRSFPRGELTSGEAFVAIDRLLDNAITGPLYSKMPKIARIVDDAIHYRADSMRHFELHAHVIMANHVHLLITPLVEVSKIMQSLKRYTALQANRALTGSGPFWQDESYDRLVRDGKEFERIRGHVEMNPVKAGLVLEPEQFRWSSAWPIDNRPQVDNLPHREGRIGGS